MKRSGPIKRKRAKPRPPGVGCQQRNGTRVCRQNSEYIVDRKRCCPKHAADRLFAKHIRAAGRCWAEGYRFECGGDFQCCHIITRARISIRWSDDNARPMCADHHVWFTHNPDAWRAFVADQGIDYDALRQRSFSSPAMDPHDVVNRLETA